MDLGETKTGDPRDPAVIAWWHAKADEIYRAIPDFGGFLVKADSEGQPGPRDYHLTQAQGANMIAGALAPHGGVLMWRAFIYATQDTQDRVRQAYREFKPLDGQFAANVLVQIKNGPLDFQPREPAHPLFGAMPGTNEMLEVQLTKEYLGFSTHLVYLGALFSEVLRWDTFAHGAGSTVAHVIDGSLDGHTLTGMAGVSNVGTDRDWSGSIFDQADWYAFGRLAWNPDADPKQIAADWVRMTFSNDPALVTPVVDMMLRSREAVVDYMTPLGLAHIMATGHHYGPGPWIGNLQRPEWNPVYYHHADQDGIGFDRTATGSNALADYAPEVARRLADPTADDLKYLLWFHHLPWTYRLVSGRTVWDELTFRYSRGVQYGAVAWPVPGIHSRAAWTRSGSTKRPRFWASSRRKPSGGAMRASPISKANRNCRWRRESRPPSTRCPGTRRRSIATLRGARSLILTMVLRIEPYHRAAPSDRPGDRPTAAGRCCDRAYALSQRSGIVHLGVGAFHRAHQAVYTDAAMDAGARDWGITGVSLRATQVRDQLEPQDGLYTVTQSGNCGHEIRLIGAIRHMLVAPENPLAVIEALAAADTRIVSLTITEKGYHRQPDLSLDWAAAPVAAGP